MSRSVLIGLLALSGCDDSVIFNAHLSFQLGGRVFDGDTSSDSLSVEFKFDSPELAYAWRGLAVEILPQDGRRETVLIRSGCAAWVGASLRHEELDIVVFSPIGGSSQFFTMTGVCHGDKDIEWTNGGGE